MMRISRLSNALIPALAALLAAGCVAPTDTHTARTETPPMSAAPPLIPREVLFGNPDKAALRISPDGRHIAFLAPVNGVLNVWVAATNAPEAATPVTQDTGRGIRRFFWAYTNDHLLYLQDQGGDENWKVYAVDLNTKTSRDLTPFETIPGPDGKPALLPNGKPMRPAAQIENVSRRLPDTILIGLNTRDPRYHDIYRVDIRTGAMTLAQTNAEFSGFVTDDDYAVRFASRMTDDGGTELLKPAAQQSPAGGVRAQGITNWEPFQTIGMEDSLTTYPVGFDKTGRVLYMIDSRGRNTSAMTTLDLDDGRRRDRGRGSAGGCGRRPGPPHRGDHPGRLLHVRPHRVEDPRSGDPERPRLFENGCRRETFWSPVGRWMTVSGPWRSSWTTARRVRISTTGRGSRRPSSSPIGRRSRAFRSPACTPG